MATIEFKSLNDKLLQTIAEMKTLLIKCRAALHTDNRELLEGINAMLKQIGRD